MHCPNPLKLMALRTASRRITVSHVTAMPTSAVESSFIAFQTVFGGHGSCGTGAEYGLGAGRGHFLLLCVRLSLIPPPLPCESNSRCYFRRILELQCCSYKGGGGGRGRIARFASFGCKLMGVNSRPLGTSGQIQAASRPANCTSSMPTSRSRSRLFNSAEPLLLRPHAALPMFLPRSRVCAVVPPCASTPLS